MDFCEYFSAYANKEKAEGTRYSWTRVQEDLATGTFKLVDFGCDVSLGDVCLAIDDFSPTLDYAKKAIQAFVKSDCVTLKDEY